MKTRLVIPFRIFVNAARPNQVGGARPGLLGVIDPAAQNIPMGLRDGFCGWLIKKGCPLVTNPDQKRLFCILTQQTKFKLVKLCIVLLAFAPLLLAQPAAAQPCEPKLTITSADNPSEVVELHVGQTYNLRVTVDCYSSCEIVVEGKKAKVKALGNNVFSITPESGFFTLDVYTVCNEGFTIESSDGKKQSVAGKKLFSSERYRAKNKG